MSENLSAKALALAQQAMKDFPECFWYWKLDFQPQNAEDVRAIIASLRRGNHKAWYCAQEIQKCL